MTESWWKIRGRDHAALEWGERGGRPTLLLHGWLDCAAAWAGLAERLEGWRLAPDLRGHGRSPHNGPGQAYFFPEYVADLDALVAELDGPVDLVGHSMGGTLATMFAAARPERVRRLVSLDGLGLADGVEEVVDRLRAFLDGSRRPPRSRVFRDLDEVADRLRKETPRLDPRHARLLAEHATVRVENGLTWSFDPRHRVKGAIPYRQDQHLRLLAELRCPVLSVHPERSPFAAADVARIEAGIARLRVARIPGTGHRLHLEDPEAVAQAVRSFLAAPEP